MPEFKQGQFFPKNPRKYIGDVRKIIYRSGWELKFMNWCDKNPNVLHWCSEELIIPYLSPLDGEFHRYFVDFVIEVRTRTGEKRKYAVEIKPSKETEPPKTKNKKRLLQETATYAVNQAKWSAAREFCKRKGLDFIVLTEHELF